MSQGAVFGQATGGGPVVKGVQYGTIGFSGTSSTATITSVDVNNSYILNLGARSGSAANVDDFITRVELTNGTTVTARKVGSSATVIQQFVVIEYEDGIIASKQTGTIGVSQDPVNRTITSVNVAKTLVINGGHSTTAPSDIKGALASLTLLDSTTLQVNQYVSGGSSTVNYQVIEFN